MNPSASAEALITIEIFRSDGSRTGRTQLTLGPGQRVSRLVKELVPESAGQVGGYMVLSSNREIVSFMLFATESLSVLSALPGS